MADRTVKVSLVLAAQGYMQGVSEAARKTRDLGEESEKLAAKKQAFTVIGGAMLAVGAAAAAGVGLAVSKFAEFDQQMSYVQAATHETTANMQLLRDAALEAGARTAFSATEAAAAVEELSKAGVSTADILAGGLDGALDLAAAGGLGVARAAEIAATALGQFGLGGDQASRVADVLAAGAGKAMGSVEDLANGLAYVGPVAASMGVSIEETAGALALFAQQGIIGEQAGTSLRGVLSSLTSPSKQARAEIERLGITLYDQQGTFLGLENAAGQLSEAYSGMTGQARDASLGIIFGNQQLTAATALYSAGAEGVAEWTAAVDDQGYAAQTAAMRLDNLAGDLEALGGAFDTALIQTGSGANDVLRGLVQTVTGAVGWFAEWPEPLQQTALYLGLAAAGVALVGGATILAIPKIAEFKATVTAAGVSMRGIALAGGLATVALTGVIAVVAILAQAQADARARAESYAAALKQGKDAADEWVAEQLAMEQSTLWWSRGSAVENATKLGISMHDVTAAISGTNDEFDTFITRVAEAGQGSYDGAFAAESLVGAVRQVRTAQADAEQQNRDTAEAQEALTAATEAAQSPTDKAAAAAEQLATEAEAAERELSGMSDALKAVGDTALGMGSAVDQAQGAINDLARAGKDGAASIYGTNDESIKLRNAMRDVETSSRDAAEAILENGGSLEDATTQYYAGRDAVIAMLEAKGLDSDAARTWADENLGRAEDVVGALGDVKTAVDNLPERKAIQIAAETEAAKTAVDNFIETYNNRTIRVGVSAETIVGNPSMGWVAPGSARGNLFENGKVLGFAGGGFPSGIYRGVRGGIHRFAELDQGVPWETYLSGRRSDRDRNLDLWAETGYRLGAWQPGSAISTSPGSAAMPELVLEGRIEGTLEVGGDGIGRLVDARITATSRDERVVLTSGRWSDA